jgi:hypothetical protein
MEIDNFYFPLSSRVQALYIRRSGEYLVRIHRGNLSHAYFFPKFKKEDKNLVRKQV